jgi:hypothetical protein
LHSMIVRLPLRRQRRRAVRFFYRRSDTSKESRAQAIPRRNSSEFLLCRAMAESVSISFSTREATACLSDATMAARKAACVAMSWPSTKLIRSTSASYAPATCDACAASFLPVRQSGPRNRLMDSYRLIGVGTPILNAGQRLSPIHRALRVVTIASEVVALAPTKTAEIGRGCVKTQNYSDLLYFTRPDSERVSLRALLDAETRGGFARAQTARPLPK